MGQSDFKDYMNASKLLQFSLIPYTKVYQLKFTNGDLHCVRYKLSHGNDSFEAVYVGRRAITRQKNIKQSQMPIQSVQRGVKIVEARKQIADNEIANNKKDDLRSMLKYMPLVDQQYYKSTGIE